MAELAETMLSIPVGAYLGAALLVLRLLRWPGEWKSTAADAGRFLGAVALWYAVQATPLRGWIVMGGEVEALRGVLEQTGALAREGVPMYALVGPYVLAEVSVGLAVVLGIALTMAVALMPAFMAVYALMEESVSLRRIGGWLAAGGFLYAWLVLTRLGMDAATSQRDALTMVSVVAVAMGAGGLLAWVNVRLMERFG